MTDESHSARLDRVEADIKELRSDLREDVSKLHSKMDAVLAALNAMQTSSGIEDVRQAAKIDAIKAKLCPSPGSCGVILPRVEKLESNYQMMHDAMQQLKGGGKVISGIWGAIGATVVAAVVWILTNFKL